jgi:hypothetical protein
LLAKQFLLSKNYNLVNFQRINLFVLKSPKQKFCLNLPKIFNPLGKIRFKYIKRRLPIKLHYNSRFCVNKKLVFTTDNFTGHLFMLYTSSN